MQQNLPSTNERSLQTGKPVIEIRDLHKSFGKSNDILKGLDLTVMEGENLVVLGKSGSGKSVLIKCLVGLIRADKGEINGAGGGNVR